eukprot:UN13993
MSRLVDNIFPKENVISRNMGDYLGPKFSPNEKFRLRLHSENARDESIALMILLSYVV